MQSYMQTDAQSKDKNTLRNARNREIRTIINLYVHTHARAPFPLDFSHWRMRDFIGLFQLKFFLLESRRVGIKASPNVRGRIFAKSKRNVSILRCNKFAGALSHSRSVASLVALLDHSHSNILCSIVFFTAALCLCPKYRRPRNAPNAKIIWPTFCVSPEQIGYSKEEDTPVPGSNNKNVREMRKLEIIANEIKRNNQFRLFRFACAL